MDRLKTFAKYALWIIGFYIFSNFLINVGLNSTYKPITRMEDNVSQISIYQSEATNINGRIKGTITNEGEIDLEGKYIKIELYSKRDVLLGTKYIFVENLNKEETIPFQVYFQIKGVEKFKLEITEERQEDEGNFLLEDLTFKDIILFSVLGVLLIY